MLLKEFDESQDAVFNPIDCVNPIKDFPKVAVSCFSEFTLNRLVKELKGVEIASFRTANMRVPIYKVTYKEIECVLFMSYVGAAGCVGGIEDVFAMGADKLVLFGTCGVLDGSIEDCSIIIPNAALRDEGTSFHYAKASDEIVVNPKYKEEFIDILNKEQCSYRIGKVWTTDAMYRETRKKVQRRKEQGCICVDMECSAVAALANFRKKEVFQFFYAADNLECEEWDVRSLANEDNPLEKDRIALLAMELAMILLKNK